MHSAVAMARPRPRQMIQTQTDVKTQLKHRVMYVIPAPRVLHTNVGYIKVKV